MSNHYESKQEFVKALEWAKKSHIKFPQNYILAYQFSKVLLMTDKYVKSLNVITKTNILPNEGAQDGRITYRQACIMSALNQFKKKKHKNTLSLISQAIEWPKNLGVGKPYLTDEGIEDYFESLCLRKMGCNSEDMALESKISDNAFRTKEASVWDEVTPSAIYLNAMILRNKGRENEAKKLLLDLKEKEPNNLVVNWCEAKFTGKNNEAEKIVTDIIKENGGTLFNPKSRDIGFVLVRSITDLK